MERKNSDVPHNLKKGRLSSMGRKYSSFPVRTEWKCFSCQYGKESLRFSFMFRKRRKFSYRRTRCGDFPASAEEMGGERADYASATMIAAMATMIQTRYNGKEFRLDNPAGTPMQIDISFNTCSSDPVSFTLINLNEAVVSGQLTSSGLNARLYLSDTSRENQIDYSRTVQVKEVDDLHDALCSSCTQKRDRSHRPLIVLAFPCMPACRYLRVMLNKTERRLTVTLMPLTFQASFTMEHTFSTNVTHLSLQSRDSVVNWNVTVKAVSHQDSRLSSVGVQTELATQTITNNNQRAREVPLDPTNSTLVQIILQVTVNNIQPTIFFHLKNSQAIVKGQLNCTILDLRAHKALPSASSLPHYDIKLFKRQRTHPLTSCTRNRTLLLMLNKVKQRLTVTLLPLTSQVSLMLDDVFSGDIERFFIDESYSGGQWKVTVIPVDEPAGRCARMLKNGAHPSRFQPPLSPITPLLSLLLFHSLWPLSLQSV